MSPVCAGWGGEASMCTLGCPCLWLVWFCLFCLTLLESWLLLARGRQPTVRDLGAGSPHIPGRNPKVFRLLVWIPAPERMVFQAMGKLLRYRKRTDSPSKKTQPENEKLYLEPRHTAARVVDADILMLVALPKGLNVDEWLASNASAFYNHVSLFYGSISEFCTATSCPTMKAWSTQYHWTDEKGRKRKCSAPQYADYAISIIQKLLTDEDLVPTKHSKEFPKSFRPAIQKTFRLLFHLLGHIYSCHFKTVVHLELHPHLNTLYLHLLLFCAEFHLLDSKEMALSEDLTSALIRSGPSPRSSGTQSRNT
ncbi:MOB kinase activator 2-like [Spea bombifrons]|uniref:MOB kinase activator 2-like n=1 Tax=Spea bombifrons TaxID=233779 RepID=UPI0023491914|nr:MOB kinase activator 2-like [Spea bombifrons]